MSHETLTWIDLPSSRNGLAGSLVGLLRFIQRSEELNQLSLRILDRLAYTKGEFFKSETLDGITIDELERRVQSESPENVLLKVHATCRLGVAAPSRGHQDDRVLGDLVTAFEVPCPPLPPAVSQRDLMRTVPPFMLDRVYPFEISFEPGQVGGATGFASEPIRRTFERLWSGLISEVRPLRLVEGHGLSDWRDERVAFAAYYRDATDFAKSLKLLYGLRAKVHEISQILQTREFRSSLPPWRISPIPDGESPGEGVSLRFKWHSDSFMDYRENPDGSPGPVEVLREHLARAGFDHSTEGDAWLETWDKKRLSFDATLLEQ